jgi:hypothetical protein
MKFQYILFSLFLFLSISKKGNAQYDTIHYVPPFFAVENVDSHFVYFSTSENLTFPITIIDGDGQLISTVTISNTNPQRYFLGKAYSGRGPILRDSLNKVLTYDGLVFKAAQPFFANVRHKQSAQGFSLTTKGAKALGTLFRTGHVYNNSTLPNVKGHTIGVMASEDNTSITFSDISSGVVFLNTPTSGTPVTSNNITITLNKGESYVIGTEQDDSLNTNNQNGVNGTLVSSNKPIAVNTGSWLGGASSSSRDIGLDQIVPYELIGKEYIFVRGNGDQNTERPLVVAIADNTPFYINNEATPYTTLNTGEYVFIPESKFSVGENMYVYSSKDFYMYQTMSGDNTAAVGMIFIPPLSCIGGDEVTIPEAEQLGTSTISITAISGSPVFVNGVQITNSSPVLGTSDWVTYKINNLVGDVTVSSVSKINVALLTTEGLRGAAGYFSGFRPSMEISEASSYIELYLTASRTDTLKVNQSGPFTSITATFLYPQYGGSITFGNAVNNEIPYSYIPSGTHVGFDYVTFKVCKDFICANGSIVSNCANYTVTIRIFGPEDCTNSLDDDQDGLIDCADDDCTPPVPTVNFVTPTCANRTGGQIQINVTSSNTFMYSISNEPSFQTNNTFSTLNIGQYYIRIQNSYGCQAAYLNNPIILDINTCIENCINGIDDDGDGDIDCADSDCSLPMNGGQIERN